MRRILSLLCILTLLLIGMTQAETLTILHVNDTHSHLLPYGPKDASGVGQWGGMARLASLVGINRMTEPNVMLLHAGDFFVGDFMFQKYVGIPELEIMKQLGYDAVELGNHEFDLYPQTLKYVLDQAGFPAAGFPVLCANLNYSADPEMGYFVRPYTIKQYGTVKVGIFGLNTEFTNSGSNPQPLSIIPPLTVAQAWIDSLRIGHGCSVVILLSHLGVDMDQAVAASTNGIDVIVGGHTHTQLNQPIKIGNTLVLQAGEFAHYLGKLHLTVEAGGVTGWDFQLVPVNSSVPEEPNVKAILSSLATGVEADPRFGAVYSSRVANAAIDLGKDFGHGLVMDNAMGNMISDAYRLTTGTDIAIQPQGFINQPIWAGPIVGNDVFQAVPYGFDQASGYGLKVATFQTTGASLLAGLEFSVYNLPYVEDFFLHASNLSFAYNSSNPPGSRVDYASVRIKRQPINPAGVYTVAVPDGVVPFLSQIPGFTIDNLVITDKFMYTVTRDFMSSHSPVVYRQQGRIFDLAALAEPVSGALACAGLPDMYLANGSISKPLVAAFLKNQFRFVSRQVAANHPLLALGSLCGIKLYVRAEMWVHHIDNEAGNSLIYLVGELSDAIRAKSEFATCTLGKDEVAVLPEVFDLQQNYPNPFNPTTRIEFSVPSAENVRLEIYNILGERVTSLIDGPMAAGLHTVEWNSTDAQGRTVASGIYFYRLSAGDKAVTKKMMLVK